MESREEDLIGRVAREMRLMSSFGALFSHAVAERIGMPNTDIETMDLLNVLGPMTAGQLSQMTGLSTGATTRLIDRLEHAGLVRRKHDDADRRRVIIEPVHENLSDLRACFMPLAKKLGELWSTFSDQDLETILRFTVQTRAAIAAENARLRSSMTDDNLSRAATAAEDARLLVARASEDARRRATEAVEEAMLRASRSVDEASSRAMQAVEEARARVEKAVEDTALHATRSTEDAGARFTDRSRRQPPDATN